jgi:hypothetical protein
MALTDAKIRAAKPDEKPYKLADSGNMFLLVHPNGSRYWRLRYRFLGKEKTLALGVYPEVSLSEAREKRDTARKLIAEGIDPCEQKRSKSLYLKQLIHSKASQGSGIRATKNGQPHIVRRY